MFTSPITIGSLDKDQALDPFYEDFKESCSARANSLDAFASERFVQALIFGRSYWLINFPSVNNQAPLSKAEWLERDLGRAWLEPLAIEQIFKWETDNGDVKWVIVHCKRDVQPDPFGPVMVEETWRKFTVADVTTYQITYDPRNSPKEDTEIPVIHTEVNRLGQVPLICLDLESQDLALMPRGYQMQIQHWDAASGLSLAIARTCTPQVVIYTDSPDDIIKRDTGLTVSRQDEIEFLSPDPQSFQTQQDRLSNLKEQIFSLCNFTAANTREPRERARSGHSREIDSSLTEVALKTYGIAVKEAVERTLNLIAAGRGEKPRFDVTGLDSFSVAIKGMTIENASLLLDMGLPIELDKEVVKLLCQKVLPGLSETTVKELYAAINAMKEKPKASAPAPSDPEQVITDKPGSVSNKE